MERLVPKTLAAEAIGQRPARWGAPPEPAAYAGPPTIHGEEPKPKDSGITPGPGFPGAAGSWNIQRGAAGTGLFAPRESPLDSVGGTPRIRRFAALPATCSPSFP